MPEGGCAIGRTQFAVVLLVVAASGFLGGAVSDRLKGRPAYAQEGAAAPKVVEAQEFRVVDEHGNGRASLQVSAEGDAVLQLANEDGKVRAAVLAAADGSSGVGLYDGDGNARLGLFVDPDGLAALVLADPADMTRASLGLHGGAVSPCTYATSRAPKGPSSHSRRKGSPT